MQILFCNLGVHEAAKALAVEMVVACKKTDYSKMIGVGKRATQQQIKGAVDFMLALTDTGENGNDGAEEAYESE